jgi:hypothetical protein
LFISLLFKEHWISKILIIIGVYTLFFFIKKNIKPRFFNTNAYFFFFLLAGISMLWSMDAENSFNKFIMLLPFVIIPLWISSISVKLKYDLIFKYLGIFYTFIGLVTLLLASIRYHTTHQISEFYYHTLSSPLSTNAIYTSLLYSIIFLFNLLFLLRKKEKISIYSYFTLIVIGIYIFLLSSKLITVLLIFSTCFILYPSLKLKFDNYKLIPIGLVIIIFILFMLVFSNNNISKRFEKILNIEKVKEVYSLNEFGDNYLWNGLNLRLLQLRAFYEIEKKDDFNSLLGVGLNNGQELLNKKYKEYKMYTGKPWEEKGGYLSYNFHNQYTQTLIEMGIIGFLFLIYIYYSLFVIGLKTNNFLLFTIIFTFILIMFTESILVRQKGIVTFVLFPLIAIKVKEYLDQKIFLDE